MTKVLNHKGSDRTA